MGILLGLGDPQLGQPILADILTHGHGQGFRREGNVDVWHGGVILGHADKVQGEEAVLPGKTGEVRIHESTGDLPGTVGPEVEEDYAVAGFNGTLFVQDGGNHEFVGDALFIGLLDGAYGAAALHALAVHHSGIGFFHPIPGVIPIHGIEPPHNGGDLSGADPLGLLDQLFHVLRTGGGGHVTAV